MAREAFVALVTCFNDDETVNYAATRAQVRRQVAAGNNIMCAGTNGDFTALTFDGPSSRNIVMRSSRSSGSPSSEKDISSSTTLMSSTGSMRCAGWIGSTAGELDG